MHNTWRKYEEEVYEECCRIYGNENVERNISKLGVSSQVLRQIDVLVHTEEGDIAFDAKYYSKHVDVKTIESMIGMYGDLGVEKFVVVTNNGYSKAALRRAHLGDENIEADVLSMVELHQMQGYGAMPYAGRNGVLLSPPFGWVVDNQISVHPGMLAVLYRRGVSFKEAMKKEREFAYLVLWDKDDEIHTIQGLAEYHRDVSMEVDVEGKWEILEETPYTITKFRHSKAVNEHIGYKEFENFILSVVLFCEEEKWNRDKTKLQYILRCAKPIHVRQYKDK